MLFDPELIPLLKQSFESHMRWVIPKIISDSERMWAEVYANKLIRNLDRGISDPYLGRRIDSDTVEFKVWSQYREIYSNLNQRFEGGARSSDPVEKIL